LPLSCGGVERSRPPIAHVTRDHGGGSQATYGRLRLGVYRARLYPGYISGASDNSEDALRLFGGARDLPVVMRCLRGFRGGVLRCVCKIGHQLATCERSVD
jgi:hypothetical protein